MRAAERRVKRLQAAAEERPRYRGGYRRRKPYCGGCGREMAMAHNSGGVPTKDSRCEMCLAKAAAKK